MKAENKIKAQLMKLRSLFGSAYPLTQAISIFGLFEGTAQLNSDGWFLSPLERDEIVPKAHAEDGWAFPSFTCGYASPTDWLCELGFGSHKLTLSFDTRTGKLTSIVPDDVPSERCWGGRDYEERISLVKRLVR